MKRDLASDVRGVMAALPGLGIVADDRTRVEPILNWGGFVHPSFRITSADVIYHVKLADEEHDLRELRRWRRLGDRLAEHYGAPPIDIVRALHADDSLAGILEQGGDPVRSCAKAYRSTYHRRFVADDDGLGDTVRASSRVVPDCRTCGPSRGGLFEPGT